MKILFIGGTGTLSLPCTRAALREGHDVYHLNRGQRPDRTPPGVTTLTADVRDRDQVRKAVAGLRFDCVVNWIAFSPEHIQQDVELFSGATDQYIFISSASAYRKPPGHWILTESTPLENPFWQYSRDKIACEEALKGAHRRTGFPFTVVRPSHTYGDGWIPTPVGSRDFTVAARMLEGRETLVHGDGQSLWTLTHSQDFAEGFLGLLGNPLAIGEAFHITSDEALTWDNIYRIIGDALEVEPRLVHVPSDFINQVSPEIGAGLLGDKAYSAVFDNTKIRRFVPGFRAVIPFHLGIRRSLAWYEEHPEAKAVNRDRDAEIDRIISAYRGKLPPLR